MRILLDESLPRRLKRSLTGHTSRTVTEVGWAGTKNGRLLARIEASALFDILLTADQNLKYQQNLTAFSFGVIVLVAADNTEAVLLPLVPDVLEAIQSIQPGQLIEIESKSEPEAGIQ